MTAPDTLLAVLAVFPVVTAIFLFFFCLFVGQLYTQLRDAAPAATKQTRVAPDTWPQQTPRADTRDPAPPRCVRSVRTLKRRSEMRRTRSVDHVSSAHVGAGPRVRARSADTVSLGGGGDSLYSALVRVRSDPYLSIPRASLKSVASSSADLNNNNSSYNNNNYSSSSSRPVLSRSSSARLPQPPSPPPKVTSSSLTREQIIQLFSASLGPAASSCI